MNQAVAEYLVSRAAENEARKAQEQAERLSKAELSAKIVAFLSGPNGADMEDLERIANILRVVGMDG